MRETHVVDTVSYTTVTGYDVAGRVRWVEYPDGDSAGSSGTPFQYDSGGRLVSVPGILTSATYNARQEPVTVTRANGVVTTYARSAPRGWLTGVTTMSGATTVQDLAYGRDAAGRISGVTSGVTGEDWTYGYDDLDRLTSATNTDTAALTQSFAYDSVGNMTSNSAVGAYTYPLPGAARPHGVTATPLGSYGYDANGNMTSAAGDTLTYDGENRLTSVNTVQFVYGADGQRLKKTAGATTTLYLGPDIEVTGGVATKYLPGDARRTGTGGGAVTHWLHRDHLDSVRVLTDLAGAVTQRGQYKPYGEQLGMAGPVSEAKGYIGERHDAETGLLYLNARYYDPVLARFVQADPSDPTQPGVGVNRYTYAGNCPVIFMDPFGLSYGQWWEGGPTDFGYMTDTTWAAFLHRGAEISADQGPRAFSMFTGSADYLQAEWAYYLTRPIDELLAHYEVAASLILEQRELNAYYQSIIAGHYGEVLEAIAVGAARSVILSKFAARGGGLPRVGATLPFPVGRGIATPYGTALQSQTPAALAARTQVSEGATLYRGGTMGKSAAGEAQFWAVESPFSPGYASRYGVPQENIARMDFIETAKLKPGADFITREAPGIGTNGGGAIEVVVNPGGVILQSFTTGGLQ